MGTNPSPDRRHGQSRLKCVYKAKFALCREVRQEGVNENDENNCDERYDGSLEDVLTSLAVAANDDGQQQQQQQQQQQMMMIKLGKRKDREIVVSDDEVND